MNILHILHKIDITKLLSNIAALYTIAQIIYIFYRIYIIRILKKIRPLSLSEEEFWNYTHYFVKSRLKKNRKIYGFNKFINQVLIKGRKQFILILGEAGTGKSTFLVNLYAIFKCKFFKRNYDIEYVPLKLSNSLDLIDAIENKGATILLLDAFDEASEANKNPQAFFEMLEEKTKWFPKVIITSRNNFFDNDQFLNRDIGIDRVLTLQNEKYEIFHICDFTHLDVIFYLIRKYKFRIDKYIKARRIIYKCGNLACRPVIISYIDLLIIKKGSYHGLLNIYNEIVENWIKREAFFISKKNKSLRTENVRYTLEKLINEAAVYMYKVFPERGDYYIYVNELKKITNTSYIDYIDGKRNRSLFNRNDDRLYFAHRSILEFSLACNFAKINYRYDKNLDVMNLFLKEFAQNRPTSIYHALFFVGYQGKRMNIKNEGSKMICDEYITYQNFHQVSDIVNWAYNSVRYPVFFQQTWYKREKISIAIEACANEMCKKIISDKTEIENLTEITSQLMKKNSLSNARKYVIEYICSHSVNFG